MAPPDDPGNPTVNFHGESRRNDTHQSTTDPEPEARTDLDLLLDAWLAVVRPRWRQRCSHGRHDDGARRSAGSAA